MQKIRPPLWFDKEVVEAAELYTSLFQSSHILNKTTLHDTPSGTVDLVTIVLCGQEFALLSSGPLFKFNPSVSFLVACETKEEVDGLWKELSKGGKPMLELGEYPSARAMGGSRTATACRGR